MNVQQSIQAENFEKQLRDAGKENTAITYMDNKIYLQDGRFSDLSREHLLVKDVASIAAALVNPNGVDESDIYTEPYLGMYESYKGIHEKIEGTAISPVAAASGPESLTHYETIRKTSDVIGNVIGQARILDELNAVNIAEKVSTSSLKGEYIRRTTSLLKVESEIGDKQIPGPVRHAYSIGKKEIFADAVSWESELRDKDVKIDLLADFQANLPGMFMQAKHDKVIALVNAKVGTNQGNWKATTGNFFDVDAAADVQVAEDAVKNFSGQKIMLLNSDTLRGYLNNTGSAFDGKAGNKSFSEISEKSGTLTKNPGVKYFVTDDITSESYVLAKKGQYIKWLQGMVINTTYEDIRKSGAPKQKFWFDFNGFDVAQDLAAFKGTTTLS